MLRIKFERVKRGWSQTCLGQRAHAMGGLPRVIAQAEISLIEAGRLTPTDEELEALGRALRISPASVLLKPVLVQDPDEVQVAS